MLADPTAVINPVLHGSDPVDLSIDDIPIGRDGRAPFARLTSSRISLEGGYRGSRITTGIFRPLALRS
jgi:hypothetical protein